jgi:DNA-directed RNA polymerase subunit N (RpoN/RPB10)
MVRIRVWLIPLGIALLALFALLPFVACPRYCLADHCWRLYNSRMHGSARVVVVGLDDLGLTLYCPWCRRNASDAFYNMKSD